MNQLVQLLMADPGRHFILNLSWGGSSANPEADTGSGRFYGVEVNFRDGRRHLRTAGDVAIYFHYERISAVKKKNRPRR